MRLRRLSSHFVDKCMYTTNCLTFQNNSSALHRVRRRDSFASDYSQPETKKPRKGRLEIFARVNCSFMSIHRHTCIFVMTPCRCIVDTNAEDVPCSPRDEQRRRTRQTSLSIFYSDDAARAGSSNADYDWRLTLTSTRPCESDSESIYSIQVIDKNIESILCHFWAKIILWIYCPFHICESYQCKSA